MTVVVNTYNEQEEKALIEFLESRKYDFRFDDVILSSAQMSEILKREKLFAEGRTTSRSWDEIKKDLDSVYP